MELDFQQSRRFKEMAATSMEDGSSRSNVILFDASKKEKFYPSNGMKKIHRKLRSLFTVDVNKDDISKDRLKEANVVIFAGPRERFSSSEFTAIKEFVNEGGSVLFMLGEGKHDTNLNFFLNEYGMKINDDSVIRTVYYKYLHPKEVYVSNGVINREIARAAERLGSTSSRGKDKNRSPEYQNNNERVEEDHTGLNFVYPYGTTMEVQKPSVPILSTGFISFPMNRPVAAVWQNGGIKSPPQGSGRIAVVGSADIFSDAWLDKEENGKLQEILIQWLLGDESINLDQMDADDPDLSEYNHLPDTEALSEQLRSCLQESEELPRDFTKLFDTDLFKYDTALIPECVQLHKTFNIEPAPLTLIPPQFEVPLPPLKPAVFPPILREAPPPALDQFDLDEHFASEHLRLAQLTNKCRDDDLEYFIKESGNILGVTTKLPEETREAKNILDFIFRQVVAFKKLNQDGGAIIRREVDKAPEKERENLMVFDDKEADFK